MQIIFNLQIVGIFLHSREYPLKVMKVGLIIGYNCFISILHFENGSFLNNKAKFSSIQIHPTVIQIVGIFLHS